MNKTVAVGDTVYAQWAVGSVQQGSGWVDLRFATNLEAWTITDVWAFGYCVQAHPGGVHIAIHDGQFETEENGNTES
jgi:hypothetical protein